jgi:hypothetical protein
VKTNNIDVLLAQVDDFELCNDVFCRFADFDNTINVDFFTEEQRVVTLAWHASGLIGNGGFEYLFEGDFKGDPGFVYTAATYATIGASGSYHSFQRALACFCNNYPSDAETRIAAYQRVPEAERLSINSEFWDDDSNMQAALARYIRTHHATFHRLLSRQAQ